MNVAGAGVFLFQSHQFWVTRDEGYTFGDGASLFFLLVLFGFGNLVMLLSSTILATQSRSWRALGCPTIAIVVWGAVIAYHFMF
jgi:hypothetical protein